jgi:hypothetical protein
MSGKSREALSLETLVAFPEDAHHLASLADEVHRTYFIKYPPLPVRWGQQITRKRRRSIRLGSYNHITCEIRVHPSLNAPQVPAFFIQSIIHHEYLHHVVGASHNRRFHAEERKFRYYRESQEWLRRNLFLLLGRKKEDLKRRQRAVAPRAVGDVPQMALFPAP